ncbi:MAG: hypothetical protein JOY66_15635 [Acetobacteraceae bacterium]|nr:hypothetical protein [Acetobacteraceae bacterium]
MNFVFLSAAFPAASHPGGAALGADRWSRLAAGSAATVAALGEIDRDSVRRLSRGPCAGAGRSAR